MDLAAAARIPGHLASFGRFISRRQERERADTEAFAELSRRSLPVAAGLDVEWLGTAGYRLTYEGRSLLIDPYLTRVPFGEALGSSPALGDPVVQSRFIGPEVGQVDAILVGHTHFDHAIDVPQLTRNLGAKAYGSDSLVRLMSLYRLEDQTVEVEPHRAYEIGPFVVRFVPSLHSKLVLGLKVPMDGALSCEHLDHLSPAEYKCGAVYGIHIEVAGTTLYHQGSANLIDDEVPTGGVDVFLAGIAGRRFTQDYWGRILPRLQPKAVVAGHFDDFFRPLDAPLGFSTNVNLSGLADEIAAVSTEIEVAAVPILDRGPSSEQPHEAA